MKTLNRNLIIVLALQTILLVVILLSSQEKADRPSNSLFGSNFSNIDELSLKNQESEVNISKEKNIWLQKDFESFHVPDNKVENLLSALSEIKIDFPVATSKEAANRFNVNKDKATTIIELKNDGKKTETLYIGSGSGLRKVHARLDGDDEIYSIELPTNLISTDKNDWIDKSMLRVKDSITSVETHGFNFALTNGVWESNIDLPAGKQLNQEAITNWVGQFTSLNIEKYIIAEKAEKITLQNPLATYSIKTSAEDNTASTDMTSQDSASQDYAFYKDNDKYYVKLFGEPKLFSILNYRADDILKTDIEYFLENAPIEPDEQQDSAENLSEEAQNMSKTDTSGEESSSEK